jgi:hypothetical protein
MAGLPTHPCLRTRPLASDLTRVQGVIELLQAQISRPLKPWKLNEAFRDYEKGVKALENYWVLHKQIFEKAYSVSFDPEARQLLAETGRIADHVMVEGIQVHELSQ